MRQESIQISQEEIQRQAQIMEMIRHNHSNGMYHIRTFGCQMNERDSQTLAGMLEKCGFSHTEDPALADILLLNTCCVRENAEQRVYGNIGGMKRWKQENPRRIIGVCGCMMQQDQAAKELLDTFPFVDLVFGTHNLHTFPQMLEEVLEGKSVCMVEKEEGHIAERLPIKRENSPSAYLTIMYGCNNYCSYCIVPYVRGRERSRGLEDIRREAETLLQMGVREVTLLGQNVNSYGLDTHVLDFPQLLREMDGWGFERIRFMSSHPKDVGLSLIQAMAECAHVCPQLHLPVQSGSNAILKAMNRKYTREHYLEWVGKAREMIPQIGITTDFLVGFPGESEADFEETLSLMEAVRFDAAFGFIYSPRKGTKAASMPDQISKEVASARIQRLFGLQERITGEILKEQIHARETILVEDIHQRPGEVRGRTPRGFMISCPGSERDYGRLIHVQVTEAKRNTLKGEKI